MRLGRSRPPILAEVSGDAGGGARAIQRRDMEAYEAALSRLGDVRTLLVTGDSPGKGAAAVGLATTATTAGRRTALLECDLAEPSLAAALGLGEAPGLSEYLRGETDAAGILKPVVLAGPGSGGATEPLVCVVAGRAADSPWGLLASDGLRRALAGLRAAYELVVIDGPPLRDTVSLAPLLTLADSTIACVDRSQSRRKLPAEVNGLVVQV